MFDRIARWQPDQGAAATARAVAALALAALAVIHVVDLPGTLGPTPLVGYILTRALPGGFLGDHGDVGNWHCPLGIAALSVESVILLLVLLAGLGAWQARIHAASVAAARRPAPRRAPEYSQPR